MDRRTVGSFIAALRRAEGMTQRDLASRLGVTDKTVSRWENDEGMPDISLIPVIADIFHITCDELLRGERSEKVCDETLSARSAKQIANIASREFVRFRNFNLISCASAVIGVIVSMILNLGFLRAYIGFFICMVMMVISAVMVIISSLRLFDSLDDDMIDRKTVYDIRNRAVRMIMISSCIIIVLSASVLPLLGAPSSNTGVTSESMMQLGGICFLLALAVCLIAVFIAFGILVRKGRYHVADMERFCFNRTLARNLMIISAVILLITAFVHIRCTTIWGPGSIVKRTEVTPDELVKVMEKPQMRSSRYVNRYEVSYGNAGICAVPVDGDPVWYDSFGNAMTFEEANTHQLTDSDGNVICEYVWRNSNIASVRYSPSSGIASYSTYDDIYDARQIVPVLHVVFVLVYVLEIMICVIIYIRKHRRG